MNGRQDVRGTAISQSAITDQELRALRRINDELSGRVAVLGSEAARVTTLEDELVEMRRHLDDKNRLQRELDREIVELRTVAAESERQLASIRRTLAYRVGQALVASVGSWRGFFALPWRLWQIWRGQRLKRKGPGTRASERPADRLRLVEEALKRLKANGATAAHRYVRSLSPRLAKEKARALVEIGIALHTRDAALAARLAIEAAGLNPREGRLRALVFDLYDVGAVTAAAAALAKAAPELFAAPAQQQRVAMIRADAAELSGPLKLPPPGRRERPVERRLAIVAPRSLPRQADVVSHRAQAVALAAAVEGADAIIITEPGHQVPPEAADKPSLETLPDGTRALRLPVGLAHSSAVGSYVAETARMIEAQLVAHGVGMVHILADNAVPLALSAAAAARGAGIDYVLDLGNVPAAGGHGRSGWEASERYAAQVSRLNTLARGARTVLFRSDAVASLLGAQIGIALPLIVPDEVPRTFRPADAAVRQQVRRELGGLDEDRPLIAMFGMAGGEEGALRVVDAMAAVAEAVPRASLAFFGSGRMGSSVRRAAAQRGLNAHVVVPDAFVRQRLAAYLSCAAAAVVPCRGGGPAGLAMPIEIAAGLALGTPVVVEDAALAHEWNGGAEGPAVMVTDGSVEGMARALIAVLRDPAAVERLRIAGRERIRARGAAAQVIAGLLGSGKAEAA